MAENLYWIAFGAVAMWLILRFVADQQAGVWDRDPGAPAPLDITPAIERQRRLKQLATERRVLEIEADIARKRERVN